MSHSILNNWAPASGLMQPVPLQFFLLLSGSWCIATFPTFIKLYLADTSPNQDTNALGIAFMPFLSITKIPARCCAGQSEYITIRNGCMRIFTFWSGDLWSHDLNTSLSVFLVPNWSISNNINVKCSRKLVYVISNDRIWFSYIHLRFQLFCLCVCLWIYSVGFFFLREVQVPNLIDLVASY